MYFSLFFATSVASSYDDRVANRHQVDEDETKFWGRSNE